MRVTAAVAVSVRRDGPLLFGFVIIEEQKNRFQSVRCGATSERAVCAIGIVRNEGYQYQTKPLLPLPPPSLHAAAAGKAPLLVNEWCGR